jgi:hypothetical protein
MNNRTRKAKGGAFEKFLTEELKEVDVKTYRIFGSGAGLQKGDVFCPNLNWLLEAKNHKHLSIVNWIKQLDRQSNDYIIPLLAFKHPASPDASPEPYIVLSLYDLIKIAKTNATITTLEVKNNKELKYALDNLKLAINKLSKLIN